MLEDTAMQLLLHMHTCSMQKLLLQNKCEQLGSKVQNATSYITREDRTESADTPIQATTLAAAKLKYGSCILLAANQEAIPFWCPLLSRPLDAA
jgi:hypothetical protein